MFEPRLPVSHLPDNTIRAWDMLLDNFKSKAKKKKDTQDTEKKLQ